MDFSKAQGLLLLSCYVHRRTSTMLTSDFTTRSAILETSCSPPALSSPPRTIILGLWPYATYEQIQYYVQGYQSLYPNARVLLLRHSTTSYGDITRALDALATAEDKAIFTPNLCVLLHLFGGGGAAQVCRLLRAYKSRTGRTLDVKAVIMDAVPKITVPTWTSAHRRPSLLLIFVYAVVVALYIWIIQSLSLCERRSRQNRRDLNDDFLLPAKAKKCYIIPERDLMFSWNGAPRAEEGGESERHDYAIKRSSVDECGRWTGDQERYWLGIEDVWDSR